MMDKDRSSERGLGSVTVNGEATRYSVRKIDSDDVVAETAKHVAAANQNSFDPELAKRPFDLPDRVGTYSRAEKFALKLRSSMTAIVDRLGR